MAGAVPVLHVPYTYFPDECGGTEVYVAGLIAQLRRHGFEGAVAAPGRREAAYQHEGIPVYRFGASREAALEQAYGAADTFAAASFAEIVDRVRPRIVHVHARSAAISERLADAARNAGAKLFFTYHTPTVTCLRGTLMFMGKRACDGVLDAQRCGKCVLQSHGVPAWAGSLVSRIPDRAVAAVASSGWSGALATGLQIPRLTARAQAQFACFVGKFDCVVAVCQWAMELLAVNGVPNSKLILCRQGYTAQVAENDREMSTDSQGFGRPLRLGYFGRLDPMKGLDILIEALRRIPAAPVKLDVYGIPQPGQEAYASRLMKTADSRVTFRDPLPAEGVPSAMADCDLVAVPSRCLETGPLVVYEAFAAGAPVLGAGLGGIAELVTDGVDGVLVSGEDPANWAQAISSIAGNRSRLVALRSSIRSPRTMREVAVEMAQHYQRVAHA